ncbi:MAG TPA: sugar ABC transporter permease [Burkholderiaceae bacterium]
MSTITQAAKPIAVGKNKNRKLRVGAQPRTIVAFLLPFFVPFVFFYVIPVIYAVTQSFLKVERGAGQYGTSSTVFAGFDQYARVFSNEEFWASIGRVGLYGIIQVPVMLALSLLIALLLDSALVKGKAFFRIVAFLPYAIPGVIAAIMWSFLYHPQISPIVDLLSRIGIHVDFLSRGSIIFSIANISTWLWTGYNMLIIFSALQAVPQEVYEAAKIDGAGNFAVAWRIKVPMILPSIILTTVFSIIGTLQLYGEPTVLAQIAPSIGTTFTPNMLAYTIASGNNYQQAGAMSVVIALATFILSFGFMRLTSRKASL